MSRICKLFGHRMPEKGWWGDALYGWVVGGGIDGIGEEHFAVELECPRCGDRWTTARFHGSAVNRIREHRFGMHAKTGGE